MGRSQARGTPRPFFWISLLSLDAPAFVASAPCRRLLCASLRTVPPAPCSARKNISQKGNLKKWIVLTRFISVTSTEKIGFLIVFSIKDLLFFSFFPPLQPYPQGEDLVDYPMSLLSVYFFSHFLLTFLSPLYVSYLVFSLSWTLSYLGSCVLFFFCPPLEDFSIFSPNLGSLGESQLTVFGLCFGFSFSLIIHLQK